MYYVFPKYLSRLWLVAQRHHPTEMEEPGRPALAALRVVVVPVDEEEILFNDY
jgi:hypothetical protein